MKYICDNCFTVESESQNPCGCGKGMWLPIVSERKDPPAIYKVIGAKIDPERTCTQISGRVEKDGDIQDLLVLYTKGVLCIYIQQKLHYNLCVDGYDSNRISLPLLLRLTEVLLDWSKYLIVSGHIMSPYMLKVKTELLEENILNIK